MNENLGKGLKPFILKYMALIMGICYLANPMHRQISSVFHEISHVLESPDAILTHPQQANHDHRTHKNGEHRLANTDHQHILLDLMDSILDASDDQHPEDDTALILIKCDKHIGSGLSTLPKKIPITTSQNTIAVEQKVKIGYLDHPEEPPQIVSA